MSTDLHSLAERLQSQLLTLGVQANAVTAGDSGAVTLQLSPTDAETLAGVLDSWSKNPQVNGQESSADQEWEATSERVSEIEGFTGGDASD